MTHVGSFELTVMFRMTNSPATFQAMMNEILRDLINEGKVAVKGYKRELHTRTNKIMMYQLPIAC